jgi:hypothetical protein
MMVSFFQEKRLWLENNMVSYGFLMKTLQCAARVVPVNKQSRN